MCTCDAVLFVSRERSLEEWVAYFVEICNVQVDGENLRVVDEFKYYGMENRITQDEVSGFVESTG